MTPQEIIQFLRKNDFQPLRDRGQNFLLDESAVQALVDAAKIVPGDAVVEIGPGPGILTAGLLERGARVAAVELDARFVSHLEEIFKDKPFTLLHGDARDITNRDLAAACGAKDDGSYAVAANLPYGITSETLIKFLTERPLPRSVTMMIQREVADRILAGAGEMSSLAVLVQTLGRPSRVRNVPRGSFSPPPKVDSAIIHIEVKQPEERAAFFGDVVPDRYFSLVRAGFAEPRKKLRNNLASTFGGPQKADQILSAAGISADLRPESLLPEHWLALAKASY